MIILNISQCRKAAGLSQAQLEQKSGMKQQQISSYETGRSVPMLEQLAVIRQAIGCSWDDLITIQETDNQ